MRGPFGVILLEKNEVILHVYTFSAATQFQLLLEYRRPVQKESEDISILEEFIHALHKGSLFNVTDWKLCARSLHPSITDDLKAMTGLSIDHVTRDYEQTLILRGMATELL